MQNKKLKNYNRSKTEILRLLWDIIIFRLAAYLLNMNLLHFYKIVYTMNFHIILTQFYINFLRQEHQMSYMYLSIPDIFRFHP